MATDVRISDDADALADLAAATIARWLRDADAPVTLGLAGGGTPRATYHRLRDEPVPWERVSAWMSDERWVPPDHEERNGLMVQKALLDQVSATFVDVPWLPDDPARAAAEYNRTLTALFDAGPPTVTLLGMGDDGHTASLFPGTEALLEEEALFVPNWVASKESWRLTATVPLLAASEHLAFLVSGQAKAGVLAEIMRGDSGLPAEVVASAAKDVTWFLDAAAASQL